jgi:hypothetical protein
MRTLPFATAVATVIALPSVAEARPVCGPAATTLAQNRDVRVYVRRGVAKTCARAAKRTLTLGSAARVLDVKLSGRYAAVRRGERSGQSLRVYDLRAARTRGERALRSQFTAVALDRAGVAAFVAPEGIGDTLGGVYTRGTAIDPAFVRVLGAVVAWRDGGQLRIGSVTDDREFEIPSRDGTLYRQGDVTIGLRKGRLVAGATALGAPATHCDSPRSCTGIETVAIAGHFVAAKAFASELGGSLTETLTVHDLSTGASARPCPPPVGAFTLDEAGAVVCG